MKNEQTESYTEPEIDFGKDIVRLGSGRSVEELGGKGAGLDRLLGNGFTVPPGFVITPAGFASVLEANGRDGASPSPHPRA